MDDLPRLALPLRVVGDRYVAVQQDTVDELITTVAVICAFPLGSRVERPEFGVPPPELADSPLDTLAVEQAIATWEPRAEVTVTERPYLPADPLAGRLRVEVSMAGSSEAELHG
jgi:phage baseplate assembly protein W